MGAGKKGGCINEWKDGMEKEGEKRLKKSKVKDKRLMR